MQLHAVLAHLNVDVRSRHDQYSLAEKDVERGKDRLSLV